MFVGTAARIKKLGKPNVTMDGVHLEENAAGSEHLLGILTQGDLKWSSYIDVLSAKLKTRLAALEKLRFVIHKSFKKPWFRVFLTVFFLTAFPCVVVAVRMI